VGKGVRGMGVGRGEGWKRREWWGKGGKGGRARGGKGGRGKGWKEG
jgi:hypothetical protein